MKKYSCIIVDDEFPALNLLEAYIDKIPELDVHGRFENGKIAIEFLNENDIDILFSDIQMSELKGTELIQLLKKNLR